LIAVAVLTIAWF